MTFKVYSSRVRTIHQTDPDFLIHDGMVLSPRAGFMINEKCPTNYRQVIKECLDNGWLMPVAYMKDSELVWDALQQ